ncbi:MAG: alpha/beta hydrolase [Holophagales bacterium]|nr:alpha/beta hydrolase [Holophagales bacterium]
MAARLPSSLHLVAPATGHNVAPLGCAPELIATFLEQGHARDLDASCPCCR